MADNPKPSVVEAPSPDEDKIAVTLSTRGGSSSIPQRRLVLTRTVPAVPIGRSSKVPSKGFVPADDNAWFENPVMSRQHAEIIAKFDYKPPAVYIKDIESFHGTFHKANNGHNNEQRLTPKELVKLTNGDIVRFGIDIFRGNQSYPPCSIEFLMEEAPQKSDNLPRRGFTVPDYIDDEEDENCENEGDSIDTAFHTKPTPNKPEPKGTVSINSRRHPLIDLTLDGDELPPRNKFSISSATMSNCNASSDVIDLTSEPNCESDVEPCTVDPGAPRPSVFDISSPAPTCSEGRPRLPTHTPISIIHTSDGRIVVPPSLTVPSDDEDMWHMYHDDDFSDEDAESMISQDPDSESDVSVVSTEDPNDLSEIDELSNHDEILSEVGYSYREIDNFDDPSEGEINDNLNADMYSDSAISSADEQDEDEEDEGEEDEGEEEGDTTTEPSNDQPRTETPIPLSTDIHQPSYGEAVTIDRHLDLPPLFHQSLQTSFTFNNRSHGRDPSPSDAALFKRHALFDALPNGSRAQQLGEKSGKFEFFAARERNRAALSQHHSPAPISAIRETLLAVQADDINGPGDVSDPIAIPISNASRSPSPTLSCALETTTTAQGVNDDVTHRPSEAPDVTSIKLVDSTDQYSAWAISGDRFINNPTQGHPDTPMVRFQPADFDMTSAYKFQQSKLATAAQIVSKTRRLPIHDLLAGEPKQCSVPNKPAFKKSEAFSCESVRFPPQRVICTPTKRSFEEAFNRAENNFLDPPRRSMRLLPQFGKSKDENKISCENIDITAMEGQERQGVPAVIPAQPESSRPTKKMRLATVAVKVAACVALGGAATFSYLVNTAPVF
ncbi:hypothetical protein E0Z10_g4057 [Xylaria hypoxylon]|uniref:FHA domain-containing protein n=1 Tax=Xylaria hypoxylon TaxID=37992 RepID=A0A4Z0Z578_9PEZI|nr:hypothetical protein E0Z10_g4057 [Xylaria hypoxylon]